MSSAALVEGPDGVYGAWETQGQVKLARIDPGAARIEGVVAAPGAARNRKHPALAVNGSGAVLLAWTEGTGWQRAGALAWQLYGRGGKPVGPPGRLEGGVPVWGLVTAYARPDGGFVLLH